ncbi:Endocuticle structural glycoprotein SgAbd-2 [Frankliniella fusca]|uniref:Endocuticle structural glycoprotein SgAbd-2 n=1 Tax=Frankliniella fusca TaxID=407009 RepID=A0AAE1GSE4_9NEOP|nr:Endocuticle structural glycoprotein SgAbd-2 [Frankliniella fusca]
MAFDIDVPGRYLYHFKTNNGIAVMEQAALAKDAGTVQGAYEWTSPEGRNDKVEYVADEIGFHPMAAHLPVAPGVPEAIQLPTPRRTRRPKLRTSNPVKRKVILK